MSENVFTLLDPTGNRARIQRAIADAIWAQEAELDVRHVEPDPNPDAPDEGYQLLVDGVIDIDSLADAVWKALK